MKQILVLIFIISVLGILCCSEKKNLSNGYYISIEEPYHLFKIHKDTFIFENAFGIDTFKYTLQKPNKMILSPVKIKDSVIIMNYYVQNNGLDLLMGDTLIKFKKSPYNNATDFYLQSKGLHINLTYLENPQYISYQNLVVTLFVENKNDSLLLTLDENEIDIETLRTAFQSAVGKFEKFERPHLTLRIFVDKDCEIRRLEPIFKQAQRVFWTIAFVVKPSFKKYSGYESQYLSFLDYIFLSNDSVYSKNMSDPHIELNTKDNINLDLIKNDLIAKIKSNDYRFIKLVLKKGMNVQQYIDTKKMLYSTIDSLRDEYSNKITDCSFNKIENKMKLDSIIIKYPRFILIENED